MKSLAEIRVSTLLIYDRIWHERFSGAGLSEEIRVERAKPWVGEEKKE
jgi:hypothetical protein